MFRPPENASNRPLIPTIDGGLTASNILDYYLAAHGLPTLRLLTSAMTDSQLSIYLFCHRAVLLLALTPQLLGKKQTITRL